MGENRYRIEAVYRAGKILEVVANSREPMSAAEIATALDIDKNMAFRQCSTLVELGLFQEVGEKFDLGMKMALYWAKKKSRLEAVRDRAITALNTLEDVEVAS